MNPYGQHFRRLISYKPHNVILQIAMEKICKMTGVFPQAHCVLFLNSFWGFVGFLISVHVYVFVAQQCKFHSLSP